MYLASRGSTPEQIRATTPVIFVFTTIVRIAMFTAAGLFTRDILISAAVLLPVALGALHLGHRLHVGLSKETTIRLIGGLLVLSGVSLLFRAAGMNVNPPPRAAG